MMRDLAEIVRGLRSHGDHQIADIIEGVTMTDVDGLLRDANKTAGSRADDVQVGGDHYKRMAVQPWAAMEAWMTHEQFCGFLLGTAIAYLGRFNSEGDGKGGLVDVMKAGHVLDKLVEVLQRVTAKCDGEHCLPACADPRCWQR